MQRADLDILHEHTRIGRNARLAWRSVAITMLAIFVFGLWHLGFSLTKIIAGLANLGTFVVLMFRLGWTRKFSTLSSRSWGNSRNCFPRHFARSSDCLSAWVSCCPKHNGIFHCAVSLTAQFRYIAWCGHADLGAHLGQCSWPWALCGRTRHHVVRRRKLWQAVF
jgi:hypothetical protein